MLADRQATPTPGLPDVEAALATAPHGGSSDFDLNPDVRGLLPPGRRLRPAAVLVPLVERPQGVSVVLTRRSQALKHHPGQIAFPGGKIDTDDVSVEAAALREADEEIGLPAEQVALLARLGDHETVTGFNVTPVVGVVDPGFVAAPRDAEVAEVFEVPLPFLLNPDNLQVHSRMWQGRNRAYYAIPYGPYYVWGATARILKGFADRFAAGP